MELYQTVLAEFERRKTIALGFVKQMQSLDAPSQVSVLIRVHTQTMDDKSVREKMKMMKMIQKTASEATDRMKVELRRRKELKRKYERKRWLTQ